ncbi:hypothetical protein BDV93DRAFT_545678, partial [Ceratobasidium sp. AG-I]
MYNKIKQKAKEKGRRYADKLLGPSSSKHLSEQSSPGSSNNSNSQLAVSSPAPRHVVAPDAPTPQIKDSTLPAVIYATSPTSVGPLVPSGAAERAAKGREDYRKLGDKLDSLFLELSGYLGGPTPPAMTPSLKNLAKGIEKEIEFALGKNERNKMERTAKAMEDPDAILECYRRIQRLVERFSLNANINIWKAVDEQTTELRLRGLSPSHSARYDPAESTDLRRNGCIPGTRVEVLHNLKTWAEDGESKKIYWLNGMAGTGKTTIAYSFCDQLNNSLALSASFFCSRQPEAC